MLRFQPTAWAKLLFLRDAGDTEIGGFGLTAKDDVLLVEDFTMILQTCTATHVEFDDTAVADFFDVQVDAGRQPEAFGRIWIHTHPGSSAEPSPTDEQTFARVFGRTEWAVMFILARGGQTYARLRYHVGPGADLALPVEIDFKRRFAKSSPDAWRREYERLVCVEAPLPVPANGRPLLSPPGDRARDDWYASWDDYVGSFDTTGERIDEYDDQF